MSAPLAHMDDLQRVEFAGALGHLQGLIGERVKATFNLYGRFFGCGVEGRLDRVETLPPDHAAISIVLDERQGLFLDPAEVDVFVGRGDEDGVEWLEFRMDFGASVVLERSR
jgi:hypothetical protein